MPKRSLHGKGAARKAFNTKTYSARIKTTSTLNCKSTASNNPYRKAPGNIPANQSRTQAKIKLLNLYNDKPDLEKMNIRPVEPARIEPDRKWFGNTRVIGQKELDKLRTEFEDQQAKKDAFTILINQRRLPMSLISDATAEAGKPKILAVEPFSDIIGPKKRRKKAKLESYDMEGLIDVAETKKKQYTQEKDLDWNKEEREAANRLKLNRDKMLEAGQSKRIWDELYKVVDASDVIIEVLDARDPMGTRTQHVEDHVKKNCPHKHIVFIINKCDLVPPRVTEKWTRLLSKEYPTIAYKASVTNPFGKATLIQLLKQFDALHKEKKTISIGFIGYPNVGKSSIINSLKKKGVCRVAPIPGETKVWQYVALTKRIYLIDCPGIVYDAGQSDTDIVLKGVVRSEKLYNPEQYIDEILKRAKPESLEKLYDVHNWTDSEDFLKMIAKRFGKLKKGGEAHSDVVAKIVLQDWQRGRIPYFVPPPRAPGEPKLDENMDNEKVLKEMQPEPEIVEDIEDNVEESKENEKEPVEQK